MYQTVYINYRPLGCVDKYGLLSLITYYIKWWWTDYEAYAVHNQRACNRAILTTSMLFEGTCERRWAFSSLAKVRGSVRQRCLATELRFDGDVSVHFSPIELWLLPNVFSRKSTIFLPYTRFQPNFETRQRIEAITSERNFHHLQPLIRMSRVLYNRHWTLKEANMTY